MDGGVSSEDKLTSPGLDKPPVPFKPKRLQHRTYSDAKNRPPLIRKDIPNKFYSHRGRPPGPPSECDHSEPEKKRNLTFRATVNLSDDNFNVLNSMSNHDGESGSYSSVDRIHLTLNNKLFQTVDVDCRQKRDKIANEILTTEQSYLKSLTLMNEIYRIPMLEASRRGELAISEDDIQQIFSRTFVDILKVNFVLLQGLVDRLSNWSETQSLGDLLLDMLPFLKMYTFYTGGWDKANELLDEYESKESFAHFLSERQKSFPQTQHIRFYLIMPIQRIPRYRLLLEDLVKNTNEDHPDLENLRKALERILLVANQVDRAIEEHKNRARLLQIQKKFIESIQILEIGRVFIKEGELTKICRKDHKKFYFWLFNDLLLYAKEMPGNRFTRSRSYPLKSIVIRNVPDDPSKKIINAMQVCSSKKSYIIYTETPEEKEVWMNEINKAIQIVVENMNSFHNENKVRDVSALAPIWVPDSECPTCVICGVRFTFIERRHHCRQCGKIVCGKCSSRKKMIPGKDKKKRVCDLCYDKPFPESTSQPESKPSSLNLDKMKESRESSSSPRSEDLYKVCNRITHVLTQRPRSLRLA